jgi:hypothetical protein
VQLLLLYMLYFFTGMLLRESVLKVRDPAVGCAFVSKCTSCRTSRVEVKTNPFA